MEDRSALVKWGFRLALLSAVIAILAVLGLRLGVMPLALALFAGLGGGAVIGVVAIVISAVGLIMTLVSGRPGRGTALAAIFLSLAVVGPIGGAVLGNSSAPRIHDISTDLQDPPIFVAILAQRTPAHNSLDRTTPEDLAALQQAAYPDLQPLLLDRHPGEAFEDVVAAVQALGWEVVSIAVEEGRVEATDTTLVMGFKDDVVVRVREEEGKALIDIRSASRVGESDLGKNAARIRALRAEILSR
ncbi:MAG: DUF1499 domain-containing protein [Rhodobiaceae bacterium]|nr:DUF1499 domain-containing protein [Rhodobiaceae bacterium]